MPTKTKTKEATLKTPYGEIHFSGKAKEDSEISIQFGTEEIITIQIKKGYTAKEIQKRLDRAIEKHFREKEQR